MLRSSVIPSEEFSACSISDIQKCCETYYKLYEELFGPLNCTYSLHVFCAHLLEIRTHGPLPETSAFKFESFYAEMRRSFVSETISPLKQILKNVLLKRNISKHICQNNIFISNYDTPMECNKLIYCYERNQYLIYEISEINQDVISCHKVGQYPVNFPEVANLNLNWSVVGIFKKGGVCSNTVKINSSQICGKVLCVRNYLITCPIIVLNEK